MGWLLRVLRRFDVAIELQVKVLIFLGRRRQKLAKGKEPKRREEKGRVQEVTALARTVP